MCRFYHTSKKCSACCSLSSFLVVVVISPKSWRVTNTDFHLVQNNFFCCLCEDAQRQFSRWINSRLYSFSKNCKLTETRLSGMLFFFMYIGNPCSASTCSHHLTKVEVAKVYSRMMQSYLKKVSFVWLFCQTCMKTINIYQFCSYKPPDEV